MTRQRNINENPEFAAAIGLFELANGFMKTQAVHVAAKLGIADLIKNGQMHVKELAELTGMHEDSLHRLLRALASIEVFKEADDKCYENTPMSSMLRSYSPVSLKPYLLLIGDQSWWNSWGDLYYSVNTGKPAFEKIFNTGYTEYLRDNPDLNETFNKCMTNVAKVNDEAIVNAFDFSGYGKIVDVGGGHGSLLTKILDRYESSEGVVFDLPHVIESNNKFQSGVSARLKVEKGNFFKHIPSGGDLYILKQIIHDWNDDLSIRILKNCRKAMHNNSRLLIIDAVIEKGKGQSVNKFFDLHMLVTAPGGRERNRSEFENLLVSAGFRLSGIIEMESSLSIIESGRL